MEIEIKIKLGGKRADIIALGQIVDALEARRNCALLRPEPPTPLPNDGLLSSDPVVAEAAYQASRKKKPSPKKQTTTKETPAKARRGGCRPRIEMVNEYFMLTETLSERGESTIAELAKVFKVQNATMRSRLERLEKGGFVARGEGSNRSLVKPVTYNMVNEWLVARGKKQAAMARAGKVTNRKHHRATAVDDEKYEGYSVENFIAASVHNDKDFVDYFKSLVISYSARGWIVISDKVIMKHMGMDVGKFALSRDAIEKATDIRLNGMSIVKGGVRVAYDKVRIR
jgi:DNA-binding Lrp family transcriptional regulator|tara:strand:+ start:148 stop:1002 length:855 start_codon:yes stop_codon:yes gene_type:complete